MHRKTARQQTTHRLSILLVLVAVIAACANSCKGGGEPTNQAAVQRTKPGIMLRGSGVAEPTLLGMTPNQERPVFYDYTMTLITTTDTGVDIERFSFSMRVPIVIKAGGEISYQNVGFETPVSLRDKEKVVIGTTTMGDKALIVVVTATK